MQEDSFEEHKWYLAGKALTGNLDAAERAEWDHLLRDGDFTEEFELVKKYWMKLGSLPFGQIDTVKDWQLVIQKARKEASPKIKKPVLLPRFLKYAAVATLLAFSAYVVFLQYNKSQFNGAATEQSFITIEAPAGSKTMVTLPDSSQIWLNAGSKVVFDNNFGLSNRRISLDGEAFFDVIKNKLPFKVHTNQYNIAVLGTAFNVQAYPGDEKVITTLVRGSLKIQGVQRSNGENEVLLKPMDRFVLRKSPGLTSSTDASNNTSVLTLGKGLTLESGIDTEREIAWKDGWLAVQGESLKNLAIKMERLYDVKIKFEDEDLKSYRYTGRIRQLSLEQVLKALELTSPIAFTIEEKNVILRANESERSKYRSLQTP